MYEMMTEIPFVDAGADGNLKLHNAVAMMMNCCQFQEYQETAFREYLESRKLAVFLFSIQLDIFRMPAFREKVRTAVRIYGCRAIYGLRQITMHDEKGGLLAIANATGAFFDTGSRKAVKLNPDELGVVFDEALPMECLPRKIPVPGQGGSACAPFTVTPSNLDPNNHLTSSVYFAIAQDALPETFFFNRVRAEFKNQARPGEILSPVLYQNDGVCTVDLRGESSLSCAVIEFSAMSGCPR